MPLPPVLQLFNKLRLAGAIGHKYHVTLCSGHGYIKQTALFAILELIGRTQQQVQDGIVSLTRRKAIFTAIAVNNNRIIRFQALRFMGGHKLQAQLLTLECTCQKRVLEVASGKVNAKFFTAVPYTLNVEVVAAYKIDFAFRRKPLLNQPMDGSHHSLSVVV